MNMLCAFKRLDLSEKEIQMYSKKNVNSIMFCKKTKIKVLNECKFRFYFLRKGGG